MALLEQFSGLAVGTTSVVMGLAAMLAVPWLFRLVKRGKSSNGSRRAARADQQLPLSGLTIVQGIGRSRRTIPFDAAIYVAGHRGLVGSAIVRRLQKAGYENLLTATREQLDLRDQAAVNWWFDANRPEYVFLVAGTVGGIMANSTRPAEFIYDNLLIPGTVVHAAHTHGVKRLLYLGSSCIYPREAPQPMREEHLLSGHLEPTNEPYAVAKIAGIKLCQAYRRQYGRDFISAMPTNLYGPGDNFDLESSHVLPALIRKFHAAKVKGQEKVTVWGSGTPRREFLHVDDLADACFFLMRNYDGDEHINVGTGKDLTIRELAELIGKIVAPEVELRFDASKPDGSPRKLLDVSRLNELGWCHRIGLEEGIRSTYEWYLEDVERALAGRRPAWMRAVGEWPFRSRERARLS